MSPSPEFPLPIPTQQLKFEFPTLISRHSGLFRTGNTHYHIKRNQSSSKVFAENLMNGVTLEMVAIGGGNFVMGSPNKEPERYESEGPQHNVTIQPFFMSKFPVTQTQWAVVASFSKVNIDLNPQPSHFKGANRPVEQISWDDAVEFCARLSKHTARRYRLPSEAEWEYAARSGTKTPFHFGETITTDLANYNGNFSYGSGSKGVFRQKTTDVGIFLPNAFNLYDIHGNVWEWCQDSWHDNYNGAPSNGTAWISLDKNNSSRLLRGGSWYDNPGDCRCAWRLGYSRDNKLDNVGFRVVCS